MKIALIAHDKKKEEIMDEEKNSNKRQFLGIWFDCCGVYGRIYKNKEQTLVHLGLGSFFCKFLEIL